MSFTSSTLIAEFPKSRREVVRVTRECRHGHSFVQLRVWFKSQDDELRPGKEGITFGRDAVATLLSALQATI